MTGSVGEQYAMGEKLVGCINKKDVELLRLTKVRVQINRNTLHVWYSLYWKGSFIPFDSGGRGFRTTCWLPR